MNIPNRFKLKGRFIEVVYQNNFVEGAHLGKWDPNSRTITIANNAHEKKKLEIFLHEFLHAASDIYGLKLTEKQIEGVDYPLARMVDILCEKKG